MTVFVSPFANFLCVFGAAQVVYSKVIKAKKKKDCLMLLKLGLWEWWDWTNVT